jgi:hypothetical protein
MRPNLVLGCDDLIDDAVSTLGDPTKTAMSAVRSAACRSSGSCSYQQSMLTHLLLCIEHNLGLQ